MHQMLQHPRRRRSSPSLAVLQLFGSLLCVCFFGGWKEGTSTGSVSLVAARHSGSISNHPPVVTDPSRTRNLSLRSVFALSDLRGGSTTPSTTTTSSTTTTTSEEEGDDDNVLDDDDDDDITQHPDFASLQAYRMKQQLLLQLRSTYLSEALARRGLPIPTLTEVMTPEGASPPQPVDWDCALATRENPKSCLFSFDAQSNTKVVAPLGSTDWIGLGTLNRLRRTDPTKIEPMWHLKYAILDSWFDPESEYSLLQHVGVQGFLLNALLQGYRLHLVMGVALIVCTLLFMPVLEYIANRILVSGLLWMNWHQWYRFVHSALPLRLLLGQMFLKLFGDSFGKIVAIVKEQLVEWENGIMEQCIPLTVGVPDLVFMPPSKSIRMEQVTMDADLSTRLLEGDEDDAFDDDGFEDVDFLDDE